ncbi:MAG: hypothetical protein EOR51_35400, partial [Mesorhizobium sp.]
MPLHQSVTTVQNLLWRSEAPPSVLPDISPIRGEIGSLGAPLAPATVAVREGGDDGRSPPSGSQVGEMSGRTEGGAKDHY